MAHWTIRQTERRVEQVRRVGRIGGLGDEFASVVDFALATTLAHYGIQENEMNENEMAVTLDEVVAAAQSAGVDGFSPVGETSVVWGLEDGSYAVSDNGEEVGGLDFAGAVRIVLENEGWSADEIDAALADPNFPA